MLYTVTECGLRLQANILYPGAKISGIGNTCKQGKEIVKFCLSQSTVPTRHTRSKAPLILKFNAR